MSLLQFHSILGCLGGSGVDDGAVCRSEDIALTSMYVCADGSDVDCFSFPLCPKPFLFELLIAVLSEMEALVVLGVSFGLRCVYLSG